MQTKLEQQLLLEKAFDVPVHKTVLLPDQFLAPVNEC